MRNTMPNPADQLHDVDGVAGLRIAPERDAGLSDRAEPPPASAAPAQPAPRRPYSEYQPEADLQKDLDAAAAADASGTGANQRE